MSIEKPFSQACENNKSPILTVLQPLFTDIQTVLEIGSGTGQHAVYFAKEMPDIHWQTSDLPENHAGIKLWLDESGLENVSPPIEFDVRAQGWPQQNYDVVFTANSLHIMAWESARLMLSRVNQLINKAGYLVIYGPFNYGNEYTSESNARFDQWLKRQNPDSGIRDFEAVDAIVKDAGFDLHFDKAMPANNRMLCWQKHI